MKRVLWAVAVVIVLLLGAALWLSLGGVEGSDEPAPGATAPTAGPSPGAAPTTGSEVPEPTTAPTEDGRLPALPDGAPLIEAPLPDSSSAEGRLVDGFPSAIMGPVTASDVISSAIATEGGVMQVTLVARTDATPEAIIAHYRDLWSGLDLIEQPGSPRGIAVTGRQTSLTLAFADGSGTGTVYTILATFRAE